MVKMIALYRHPQDLKMFEKHYLNVHLPLVEEMPGLIKTEIGRMYGPSKDLYMITEMYFADKESLANAMKSEEGKKAAEDLMSFAKDEVSVYFAEVQMTD